LLCDVCKVGTASVHATHSVNGVLRQTHLCGDCTRRVGLSGGYGPVGKLVGVRGELRPGTKEEAAQGGLEVCPGCGLTFDDFKRSGRLGCPRCYDSFADRLVPVILNYQGSLRHRGKTPPGAKRSALIGGRQNKSQDM
jgi:protein arginine kinase activator